MQALQCKPENRCSKRQQRKAFDLISAPTTTSADPHYVYTDYGGRVKVGTILEGGHHVVQPAIFRAAALRLLGLEETDDWIYAVDQYRNQELNKKDRDKPFLRTFNDTKDTFNLVYNSYLEARVSNTLHDWVMVVRFEDLPDQAPRSFRLPSRDSRGSPPEREIEQEREEIQHDMELSDDAEDPMDTEEADDTGPPPVFEQVQKLRAQPPPRT